MSSAYRLEAVVVDAGNVCDEKGVPSHLTAVMLESVDQGNGMLQPSAYPVNAFTGVHCHYLSVRPVFPLLSSSSVSQCGK